ncbi:hypothetical protein HYH02_006930 [Chlamydomonas schloesseri]|uniref:TPM domain-containing protein n=1 Tax=Chlamydomonas schloesseri TaxID=2026947 RepID=A0A835WIQ8_9CHLO|nr:hypothetical protein HYH02_006930 [Chlamydomonas schloesseri]|eukprot:KAG2448348.1 hypothetical protein HYH02_006930 [Chlamydomonas schloesseri]
MQLCAQKSGVVRPAKSAARPSVSRKAVVCRAQQQSSLGQKLASFGAAATLALGAFGAPAIASEFDILGEPTPTSNYFIDDASVLSKATRSDINKRLKLLEIQTGYRVEVVTVRRLEFETDAFAFADKVLENWYPTAEAGKDKGLLLVVTASKEGAVTGGAGFTGAVGDELIDSIISTNIPIFTEEEKYNQTVVSAVERLEAKLLGNPVPEAPVRNEQNRERTYRTKEETEKSRNVTSTVVGTLLLIAVVVPMLQYYGYTARD